MPNTGREKEKKSTKLEDQAWYHGTLPRDAINRLLIDDGMFIVRISATNKGKLLPIISVRAGAALCHVPIEFDQQKHDWHLEGDVHRPTIVDLIQHYYNHKTPITKKTGAILKTAVKKEKWLIDDRNLKEERLLGSGAFGEVWLGILKKDNGEKKVAIKKVKESAIAVSKAANDEERMQIVQEAKQMYQYRNENVVKLYGIACDKPPIRIVMEYCPMGSLDEHLKEKKLPLPTKLQYCLEAASGMKYLAAQKCIHRDLAARNCLIGDKGQIKISDFGLSKKARNYRIKNLKAAKLAIRWTAPEALTEGIFSEAADVWSFGVLMWEIFADAQIPWPEYSKNVDVCAKVKTGEMMKPPAETPNWIYDIMVKCWKLNPKDRVTFRQLVKDLTELPPISTQCSGNDPASFYHSFQ